MNEIPLVMAGLYSMAASIQPLTDLVGKHPKKDVWQIYPDVAPEGATYPLALIVYMQDGKYGRSTTAGKRLWRGSFQIKIVVEGESYTQYKPTTDNPTDLTRVVHYIHDTFKRTQMDVPNSVFAGIQALTPIRYPEMQGNLRRNHIGTMITVSAQSQGSVI